MPMQFSSSTTKSRSTFGFTLVEMIVYIGVLTLVAAMSIGAMLALQDVIAQYRAQQLVQRSVTTALERVLYDIRESDTVVSSSYDASGFLTLNRNGTTITYATSSNSLHVTEGGVDLGPLTGDQVVVDELRFYAYNDVSEFVRVSITLTGTIGSRSVTRTFHAGAVLRGSYE